MDRQRIEQELSYRTSRSSGAGGQHVNKVETRVELLFVVTASEGLSEAEKARIQEHLAARITQEGILLLSDQSSRSQQDNRRRVTERFFALLEKALQPRKKRKPVKTLQADPQKRRELKSRRSQQKALRQKGRHLKPEE